jgi:hypothetical protein
MTKVGTDIGSNPSPRANSENVVEKFHETSAEPRPDHHVPT